MLGVNPIAFEGSVPSLDFEEESNEDMEVFPSDHVGLAVEFECALADSDVGRRWDNLTD